MNKSKTLQILNILGLLSVIFVNFLANALPIAGRNTGEISDLYPNLFVPAGYAFSIWGLIYSLLIVFIVLQARGLFKAEVSAPAFVPVIGWWFVISCVANATWIFVWHNLLVVFSLIWMLLILLALIQIYLRLNQPEIESPLFVRLPFSIYLGWITVATVANATALLVHLDWNGFGLSEVSWTVIMVAVATCVALVVIWIRKDIAYMLVIIWAFIAIVVKRQAIGNPDESAIITSIYVCIALMVLALVARLFWKTNN